MAVVHPGDHRAQFELLRLTRQVGQGGVALEHRLLGRADHADLEVVVHDRQRVEADLVGSGGDAPELATQLRGSTRRSEVADREADAHAAQPTLSRAARGLSAPEQSRLLAMLRKLTDKEYPM